jgi:ferredoxin
MASVGSRAVARRDDLARLFTNLQSRGYALYGPVLRDETIALDRVGSIDDLPSGWSDEQDGGHYRLKRRSDGLLFAYVLGAQGWKRLFYPPRQPLWRARRAGARIELTDEPATLERRALIGVRPCELAALEALDRVLTGGPFVDSQYRTRRQGTFLVAVNCSHPGGTCFCVSMWTGPKAVRGFDVALTEVADERGHRFVLEAGSEEGEEVLAELQCPEPSRHDVSAAERVSELAAKRMGRYLDTTDLRDLLYRNVENAWWDDVASRCLACGNCTMVCPTCFCGTITDHTSLRGDEAERARLWDSCFSLDFSYIHGGSVRQSGMSRYRQWLTHKLAAWIDQFGSSGCVGCGRCITWCPVGIDLTAEAKGIRNNDVAGVGKR